MYKEETSIVTRPFEPVYEVVSVPDIRWREIVNVCVKTIHNLQDVFRWGFVG